MLELSSSRKNKINLSDYPFEQDIENRILFSDLSVFDHQVLEEILFSSLKFSLKKMAHSLACPEEKLRASLAKLSQTGLLAVQGDTAIVDKELRKYFECQQPRFDPQFKPTMDYVQEILRKVPIHLLPNWYAVPRTSNNIFSSIVEKYLHTPQIFQRYLAELNLGNPIFARIFQDVFQSKDLRISSSDLIAKYNLTRRDFEEIILLLEFNFVCCLVYEKEEDHWVEWVVPFHEWGEYLTFLRKTEAPPLPLSSVKRKREKDFAFIEDMAELLCSSNPVEEMPEHQKAIEKLLLVQLAEKKGQTVHPTEKGKEWLEMSRENQALYLYRHPLNKITHPSLSDEGLKVREAEKAIKRVLHGQWVAFDDFLKGVLVPLSEQSTVLLKKTGGQWKYTLPIYSEKEQLLLKVTIFEWLFEMGLVAIGRCEGRDCFSVTPFGRFFFED